MIGSGTLETVHIRVMLFPFIISWYEAVGDTSGEQANSLLDKSWIVKDFITSLEDLGAATCKDFVDYRV